MRSAYCNVIYLDILILVFGTKRVLCINIEYVVNFVKIIENFAYFRYVSIWLLSFCVFDYYKFINEYFILKLFEGSVFGMETPLEVLFFFKKGRICQRLLSKALSKVRI
jgi:hypothetical protein